MYGTNYLRSKVDIKQGKLVLWGYMNRMPEVGGQKRDLSILEKAEITFSDHGREAWKNIGFAEAFRDLSKSLAGAYHVSDNIYSQTASSLRLEQGTSINRAKEFLNHVDYNPNKAEDIVKDFAKTHKPTKVYLGRDVPINLGVTIGSDELLSLGPESTASGRSSTIAALAQRAARLESLLTPEGIPEAYATAQGQVGRALKVVEKAALLAYDWNTNWGRLNVETVLDHAKSVLTKQKITKAGLVIALSLAGCDALPLIQIVTPDLNTPPAGEVTQAETVPGIETPTPSETPIPPTETPAMPESLSNLPQDFVAVHNEDGSWGIGREVNGETVAIPGINFSEDKLMLNLGDGETLDITEDINSNLIKIIDHESGALIIDSGERIGYIWKGDKWAEILLQIKFETDGTKFNEFPVVNYEDVTSGALAEAERLKAPPFSQTVNPQSIFYSQDVNYGDISPNFSRPEIYNSPIRFAYFYQTSLNDVPVIMMTLQVLNSDNTSAFIHIAESKNFLDGNTVSWEDILRLKRSPVFYPGLSTDRYDYCKNGWSQAVKQVCLLNTSQKASLESTIQKWISEQKIPGEIERFIFALGTKPWR